MSDSDEISAMITRHAVCVAILSSDLAALKSLLRRNEQNTEIRSMILEAISVLSLDRK